MTKIQLPVMDSTLKEKVLNALTDYLLDESSRLGYGLERGQIDGICRILLSEDGASFDPLQVSELAIFEKYRKKELSVLDYLHHVSIDLRKQLGQYATPVNIVKYILKSVRYDFSLKILDKRLIDPACGSGAFLVETTRVYLSVLKKANIPMHKWYPMVVSAITGIDIDPVACLFARLNLSMLLAPAILEFVSMNKAEKLKPLPVHCFDTLEMHASEKSCKEFLYDSPIMPLKGRFDFVVGNPPYFKIKGLKENLKNAFSESIYGHPNAYGLFLHSGIDMLKAKGELGFIVPRSMLSGLYFKNLRNYIESKTSLREITCISDRKKVFEKVLHGTMILSLQRNRSGDNNVHISRVQSLNGSDTDASRIVINRDSIIQRLNGTTVWFVANSAVTYRIIGRIVKQHPLLSGRNVNCQAKTGQIVWNRVKPLLRENSGSGILPLIWATDVGKFGFSFNKTGESRPPFLKIASGTSKLIVKGPSILVQRVTADEQPSRIVACLPATFCNKERNGYFVENHLNIIKPIINAPDTNLYFILGVLNSEVVDFFFRAMNGNTQVSATELNLLPIPKGKLENDIAAMAEKIQATSGKDVKNSLIQDLNSLVAEAYGLTDNDLKFIRQFLYSENRSDN